MNCGQAVKSWKWRRGFADPPAGIDLLLTDACNLRCSYCPLWGGDAARPARAAFMDAGAALALVEDVAAFRPSLRLFGGEPLLHPAWPRVVREAGRRGLSCSAVTNGVRLREQAAELVASGLYALGVSLDGAAAANDPSRGEATFDRVAAGIEALQRAKADAGSETPHLEIFTTVHPGNAAHLVGWAEELRSWGIHTLRLQHLIWFTREQLEASVELLAAALPAPSFFGVERSFLRDHPPGVDGGVVEEQLRTLRRRRFPFRVEVHPDLPDGESRAFHGDPGYRRQSRIACRTMERYAFVDPRGRLYPCLSLDMGNVFERPFLRVWNDRRFRSFRRLIRRQQRLPFCQRCPD